MHVRERALVERVPDDVWDKATARAKAEGTTVTAVILTTLTRYAKGYKP